MKTINLFKAAIFAVTCSFIVSGQALKMKEKPKGIIEDFSFIAGCWEQSIPEKTVMITEYWMTPLGDSMLGMSRTIRNGKMAGYESMRIQRTENGIDLISKPSENPEETAFHLIRYEKGRVVFENLDHDFPQRIIYSLTSPDKLDARIEGMSNGKLSGIDFSYRRVACN